MWKRDDELVEEESTTKNITSVMKVCENEGVLDSTNAQF
jgi:hypothetical protein